MLGPGNIVWREGKEFSIGPIDANGVYTSYTRKTWTAVCPYFWVIKQGDNGLIPFTLGNGRHAWWFNTWEEAAQFAFERILMQRLKGEA